MQIDNRLENIKPKSIYELNIGTFILMLFMIILEKLYFKREK